MSNKKSPLLADLEKMIFEDPEMIDMMDQMIKEGKMQHMIREIVHEELQSYNPRDVSNTIRKFDTP